MRIAALRFLRASAATALVLTAGCGDDPTAPGIEPQITNLSDAFSYQVSSIQDFTGSYSYTWQNTGTVAKITHASDAGAAGSATLTVRDAEGNQVYSGQLATSGEPLSDPAGVAGAWTITIAYADYNNSQVNFAVLKQ
jgi:hypothetical protein